jgi:hypothetical protein
MLGNAATKVNTVGTVLTLQVIVLHQPLDDSHDVTATAKPAVVCFEH